MHGFEYHSHAWRAGGVMSARGVAGARGDLHANRAASVSRRSLGLGREDKPSGDRGDQGAVQWQVKIINLLGCGFRR